MADGDALVAVDPVDIAAVHLLTEAASAEDWILIDADSPASRTEAFTRLAQGGCPERLA